MYITCIFFFAFRYLVVNGRARDASPCCRLRTKFEAESSRQLQNQQSFNPTISFVAK